ncbi:MAG: hypothetical protein K2L08_06455, partial [Erysipelotrichaceae bacterium]|nr:hypothetical protein [Erysipelotrichaceae bacterium]
MKKKIKYVGLCIMLAMGLLLPQADNLKANDFASNEGYYLELCSVPRPSKDEAAICTQFKEYYKSKGNDLEQQISSLNRDMSS